MRKALKGVQVSEPDAQGKIHKSPVGMVYVSDNSLEYYKAVINHLYRKQQDDIKTTKRGRVLDRWIYIIPLPVSGGPALAKAYSKFAEHWNMKTIIIFQTSQFLQRY